jgi:hypothetical protein
MKRLMLLVLAVLAVAPCLRAESLGDVAKREEERRKKIEASGKGASQVIKETELWQTKGKLANEGGSAPAAAADSPSVSSTSSLASRKSDTSRSNSSPAGSNSGSSDEQAWRQRAASARQELAAAQSAYDQAMKEQLGPGAWLDHQDDDANQRALMAAMQELKAKQDAAKQRLDKAKAALDNLEEDARRAGALPGWIR